MLLFPVHKLLFFLDLKKLYSSENVFSLGYQVKRAMKIMSNRQLIAFCGISKLVLRSSFLDVFCFLNVGHPDPNSFTGLEQINR